MKISPTPKIKKRRILNSKGRDLTDQERAGIGEKVRQGIQRMAITRSSTGPGCQYFADVSERGKKRLAAEVKRPS